MIDELRARLKANEILEIDPRLWISRFLGCGAIVAVRTRYVVNLKFMLLDAYCWFFTQLQQLRPIDRASEPVLLFASVLTYLTHGLVKRPDEMSSSRFMAKSLSIVARARQFGFASVPMRCLSDDRLGMINTLSFSSYKILDYTARKNPAGARLKSARLLNSQVELLTGTPTSFSHSPPIIHAVNETELRTWLVSHVNQTLEALSNSVIGNNVRSPTPVIAFANLKLDMQRW
ncbi:capsular polysaccharide export protein [Ceratobasidium sp. AG-Ba]|nr:capsular polysaccharide export protein [Ceratobasidium sp. AG-Ba]